MIKYLDVIKILRQGVTTANLTLIFQENFSRQIKKKIGFPLFTDKLFPSIVQWHAIKSI